MDSPHGFCLRDFPQAGESHFGSFAPWASLWLSVFCVSISGHSSLGMGCTGVLVGVFVGLCVFPVNSGEILDFSFLLPSSGFSACPWGLHHLLDLLILKYCLLAMPNRFISSSSAGFLHGGCEAEAFVAMPSTALASFVGFLSSLLSQISVHIQRPLVA